MTLETSNMNTDCFKEFHIFQKTYLTTGKIWGEKVSLFLS